MITIQEEDALSSELKKYLDSITIECMKKYRRFRNYVALMLLAMLEMCVIK